MCFPGWLFSAASRTMLNKLSKDRNGRGLVSQRSLGMSAALCVPAVQSLMTRAAAPGCKCHSDSNQTRNWPRCNFQPRRLLRWFGSKVQFQPQNANSQNFNEGTLLRHCSHSLDLSYCPWCPDLSLRARRESEILPLPNRCQLS